MPAIGRFDDGVQGSELDTPAQFMLYLIGIGIKSGRIALATWREFMRHLLAAHALHAGDDFLHRVRRAGAKILEILATGDIQTIENSQVGPGEIVDVDIIA